MKLIIVLGVLFLTPMVLAKETVTVTLYLNQDAPEEHSYEEIYSSPQNKMKQLLPYALVGGSLLLSLLILFKK